MAKPDRSRPNAVSDRQCLAIDALVQGATHQDAAKLTGVARTTVTEWANHNVPFIAELNVRREARILANADRLHTVFSKALSLLEREIDAGEANAAIALLRLTGLDHLANFMDPGPSNHRAVVAELANEIELAELGCLIAGSSAQEQAQLRSDTSEDIE